MSLSKSSKNKFISNVAEYGKRPWRGSKWLSTSGALLGLIGGPTLVGGSAEYLVDNGMQNAIQTACDPTFGDPTRRECAEESSYAQAASEDLKWAGDGLVYTVISGVAFCVAYRRGRRVGADGVTAIGMRALEVQVLDGQASLQFLYVQLGDPQKEVSEN